MELKGLTASIFIDELIGECSNGGISSRCKAVTVVGIPDAEIFSAGEDRPAVKLVKRQIMGKTVVHAEPVEAPPQGCVGWMMGGSYISTSDGRFGRAVGFYGAVALHDRCETPEQYRQLSI